MENFTYGLDVATALSVMAAAVAFIWNSVLSRKRESRDRQKDAIKKSVFQVSESLFKEQITLNKEILQIKYRLMAGETTQNLEPFAIMVENLPYIFKSRVYPLDNNYGDGRFISIASNFETEMEEVIVEITQLTTGSSDKSWDFEEHMMKPLRICESYTSLLLKESENLIREL